MITKDMKAYQLVSEANQLLKEAQALKPLHGRIVDISSTFKVAIKLTNILVWVLDQGIATKEREKMKSRNQTKVSNKRDTGNE